MSHLGIQLLGGFQLFWNDARLTSISAPRTQSLLAYLLLQREVTHARRGVAFRLWPDSSEKQAQTNLRRQLYFLRNGLPDADRFLAIDHATISWRQDAPWTLDVATFRTHLSTLALQANQAGAAQGIETLEQAVDCYRGDLLPDCYDDWLLPLREELRQEYLGVLERLLQATGAAGDYQKSIAYGQRLLHVDPLREETYRCLMDLHLRAGERAKALAVYHECVAILARELGVAASTATTQMYEQILAQQTTTSLAVPSSSEISHDIDAVGPVADDAMRGVRAEVASISQTALVGRQTEWQRLLRIWRHSAQGQAHLVVIHGEAGVGKSRLAEELANWVGFQDLDLAFTRSYMAAGSLAYSPIIDWLRSARIQSRVRQLMPEWLIEVTRLLPELRQEWSDLPASLPLTDSWQRRRLYEAIARGFTTDPRPLLLVLDDLQWCDTESLHWLDFFLAYCAQMPVLMVGTLRSEELDQNSALAALLSRLQLDERVTMIALDRLDRAAADMLAQQMRDGTLSEYELDQLYTYTDGNPFFLVETLRANLDIGSISLTAQDPTEVARALPVLPTAVPAKVSAVIRARLTTLSAPARALAQQLAVFGRACTIALLTEASGTDEDSLVYWLDELWQRQIIREWSSATDLMYDFSHDRIRDVAYLELSTAMRRLFHRRAAAALEALHGDSVSDVSAQLAHHHEQTGRLESARHYYRMSGAWAAAHFAHEDGLRLLARGLALCQDEATERYAFLRIRERVFHVQAARTAQARDLAEMARLADELDDDKLRGETAIRQADYALGAGQYTLAAEAAERAISVAQRAHHTLLEAEGLVQRGMVCWNQGRYPETGIYYERALSLARQEEAAGMEAKILQHLGALHAYCGTPAYARRMSQQALDASRRIGDQEGEIWTLNQLAYEIVEQGDGDYEEALDKYEVALALAQKAGYRAYMAKILSNTAVLHIRRGNYRAASACLEQSLAIAQETDSQRHRAFALTHWASVYSEQADYSSAIESFSEALQLFQEIGYRQGEGKAYCDRSWVHLMAGDHGCALADAEQALQIAQAIHLPREQAYAHLRRGYVLECQAHHHEATAAYSEASTLFKQTEQRLRALEPQAGLLRLALAKNDFVQAKQLGQPIMALLPHKTLDATTEAFWVYETWCQMLLTLGDAESAFVADQMKHIVESRASTIDDPVRRREFKASHSDRRHIPFFQVKSTHS